MFPFPSWMFIFWNIKVILFKRISIYWLSLLKFIHHSLIIFLDFFFKLKKLLINIKNADWSVKRLIRLIILLKIDLGFLIFKNFSLINWVLLFLQYTVLFYLLSWILNKFLILINRVLFFRDYRLLFFLFSWISNWGCLLILIFSSVLLVPSVASFILKIFRWIISLLRRLVPSMASTILKIWGQILNFIKFLIFSAMGIISNSRRASKLTKRLFKQILFWFFRFIIVIRFLMKSFLPVLSGMRSPP